MRYIDTFEPVLLARAGRAGLGTIVVLALLFCLSSSDAFAGGRMAPAPLTRTNCVDRSVLEDQYQAAYVNNDGHYAVLGLKSEYRGSTLQAADDAAAVLNTVSGWTKARSLFINWPIDHPQKIVVARNIDMPRVPRGLSQGVAMPYCGNRSSTVILIPTRLTSLPTATASTLTHELVHAFQNGTSFTYNAPSWYGEASAELAAFEAAHIPADVRLLDNIFLIRQSHSTELVRMTFTSTRLFDLFSGSRLDSASVTFDRSITQRSVVR